MPSRAHEVKKPIVGTVWGGGRGETEIPSVWTLKDAFWDVPALG